MTKRMGLLGWGMVAFLASACGGAASRAANTSADGAEGGAEGNAEGAAEGIDGLTAIDGTTIGTPASAIRGLAEPRGFTSRLRKLTPPRPLYGRVPLDAIYQIVEDEFAGAIWTLDSDDCDHVAAEVRSRVGPPEAVFPGGWTGKRLALRIIELGGQCMMTYGIKELFVPNASFGPFSSAPPRLGGVELGAKRESFRGMKLVDELDGTSWYEPKKKAFDSLPLDELTYAFHDGTLGHIGFGSSDLEVCEQLLARFKATFGASDKLRNYSGGMSYTWRGEGDKYTFKFNQFRKKCSGILLAGKSPF